MARCWIFSRCREAALNHRTIAALYVLAIGPYSNLHGVEIWPESRDARKYNGPWPVIAHTPCERWGRYWNGGPSARVPRLKGNDAGCFRAALRAVWQFGGVLEHPEASSAWAAFGLAKPPRKGGWIQADAYGGWTCCVEQGNYGHRARKMTWLYANGVSLPDLMWGSSGKRGRLDAGFHSTEDRQRAVRNGICQMLSHKQRLETPIPFRDLLIAIARTARI